MKRCLYSLSVLLALSLLTATWSTTAAAPTPTHAVNGSAPVLFQAPTATPSAPAADDSQENSPNWILGILVLFGGMVLLLVLGIGAAILLARLKDRIR